MEGSGGCSHGLCKSQEVMGDDGRRWSRVSSEWVEVWSGHERLWEVVGGRGRSWEIMGNHGGGDGGGDGLMRKTITFLKNGQLGVIGGKSIIRRPSRGDHGDFISSIGTEKVDRQLEWRSLEVCKSGEEL